MKHATISLPACSEFSRCNQQSLFGRLGDKSSCQRIRISLDGQISDRVDLPKGSRFATTPLVLGEPLTAEAEQHWVYAAQQAFGLRADGSTGTRIELAKLPIAIGEYHEIGEMLEAKDSLYLMVCSSRSNNKQQSSHHDLTASVAKLSKSGQLIWATAIPVGQVEHDGVAHANAQTKWKPQKMPPWTPTTWQAFGHDCLVASGNRIMARVAEVSSGVGQYYLMDSQTGKMLWQSAPSSGGFTTPADRGEFLVGDQGYGQFETNLIQADGKCSIHWDSHGHSFLCDSNYYSIQMANTLSRPQRCVLMAGDGSISEASEPLGGYYTTKPQRLADGSVYFWRNDKIWKWDLKTGVEPIVETKFGHRAFGSSVKFSDTSVGFCILRSTEPKLRELVVVDL